MTKSTFAGIRCIASPVFNSNDVIEGVIGISGPSIKITPSKINGPAARIREIAEQLSFEIGYKKMALSNAR